MPAKHLYRVNEEKIFCHIFNKGVEGRSIFADDKDYEVFLGFLKDYLETTQDNETLKKDFTVKGRVFRGTPHQPKNYFGKVELVAYNLMPDHFHLLLHQVTRGSLERFIRSLCTRYSMYFNKKYQRSGSLFEGPYKSIQIADDDSLVHLTRYLHQTGDHTSYPEYLGKRETSWIKPKKGRNDYKTFVEDYELDDKEEELLAGIIFESTTQHLEKIDTVSESISDVSETSEDLQWQETPKSQPRIPEIAITFAVFLLLLGLGVRNINISASEPKNIAQIVETAKTEVLSITTESSIGSSAESPEITTPDPTSEPIEEPKTTLVVTIKDGSPKVNIRQKPNVISEKIGEAYNGDIFEFVSIDSGWYEVKLENEITGFINAKYIEVQEGSN